MAISVSGQIERAKLYDLVLNADSSLEVNFVVYDLDGNTVDINSYSLEFRTSGLTLNSDTSAYLFKGPDASAGQGTLRLKEVHTDEMTNLESYTLRLLGAIDNYTFLTGRIRFDERRFYI